MAGPETWAPHRNLALVSLIDDGPMTDDDWRLSRCLHQAYTTDLRATRTRTDLAGRGDRNKTFIKLTLCRGNQCASQNATGNMLIDSLLSCFFVYFSCFVLSFQSKFALPLIKNGKNCLGKPRISKLWFIITNKISYDSCMNYVNFEFSLSLCYYIVYYTFLENPHSPCIYPR